MRKFKIDKPIVTSLVVVYGVGCGTGYFKDVPTKALSLLATANSTASTVNFKMPDMVNHSKEYDLRPLAEANLPFKVIWPSS